MKTFKLFLAVTIMASLLAIPCTTSFAENTLSANPTVAHVVKKEEVKKERGFFEKIGDALKSIMNFFFEEKPATTEQRKTAGLTAIQPGQQAFVNIPKIEPEVAEAPAKVAEPVDIPQVQPRVQDQQPPVAPPAPASPGATHATTQPVITVTQSPVTPQQVVNRKDVFDLEKIEVVPEKNIPEAVEMPSVTAKQEVVIPKVAKGVRETEAKIEQPVAEAPKIATIVQAPVIVQARIPSVTTPTTAETRTTATTTATRTATTTTTTSTAGTRATTTPATTAPIREVVTVTTGTRTTATAAPTEPTRITAPTQTTEPTPAAPWETPPATEPAPRPTTSYTETFEGQTIIGMTVAPVETFAIVDTVDNNTANIRTFIVSLSGEGRTECPAPASIPTGDTMVPRTATTTRTLTTAGTIQQVQAISDTLKAEMLAQCPLELREPTVSIIKTDGRITFVQDNSIKTLSILKNADEETPPPAGGDTTPPETPSPPQPPKLAVEATPSDCQVILSATVSCSEPVDCTGDYVFEAIVAAGNTVLNDFVTRLSPSSFLIAPPKEPAAEPAKGLSLSLNKAEITGQVTITVTAKKGDSLLEKVVDDVPNREDLIARCVQPDGTTEGVISKAYDEIKTDEEPRGGADISGGGCSLIRR